MWWQQLAIGFPFYLLTPPIHFSHWCLTDLSQLIFLLLKILFGSPLSPDQSLPCPQRLCIIGFFSPASPPHKPHPHPAVSTGHPVLQCIELRPVPGVHLPFNSILREHFLLQALYSSSPHPTPVPEIPSSLLRSRLSKGFQEACLPAGPKSFPWTTITIISTSLFRALNQTVGCFFVWNPTGLWLWGPALQGFLALTFRQPVLHNRSRKSACFHECQPDFVPIPNPQASTPIFIFCRSQ